MPTYDYRCKACGHQQEEFHPMSKSPRIKCEKCGKLMKMLIGKGSGVIFKGSGFYETDYRKPERTNKSVVDKVMKEAPKEQLEEGGLA